MPETNPAELSLSATRRALRRRRARKRHNPWIDRALIAGGVICAAALALGIYGQQRLVSRMASEVAELRQANTPSSGNAEADARPGAAAIEANAMPQPTAALEPAALASLQTGCVDAAPALAQYQRQFLAPMHYWGTHALAELPTQRVTYLFAGPDSATAVSVFPRARHLVLVANQALENAGAPAASAAVQASECRIWRFFARMGYFRTNDLDGRSDARPRVAAMLMHGLILADLDVTAAEYLALDTDGTIQAVRLAPGQRPFGIRFFASRPDGSRLAVDYVTIDLSDAALQRNTDQAQALRGLLTHTVLMKAASHLPQAPQFSSVARWTAELAPAIVQDETGLSVRELRASFALRYYGQFAQAHRFWRGNASVQALRQEVAGAEVEPLLFTFGYEKPQGSLLLVGRRSNGAVTSAPALAPSAGAAAVVPVRQ